MSQVVVHAVPAVPIALPPPAGAGIGRGSESGSRTQASRSVGLKANRTSLTPAFAETAALTVAVADGSRTASAAAGNRKVTTGGAVHQVAGVWIQAGDENVLSLPSRSAAVTTYPSDVEPGKNASVKDVVAIPAAACTKLPLAGVNRKTL